MYPASAAFKSKILGDHTAIAKAEVWTLDQKLIELPIASGSVNVDALSATRRVCQVVLTTTRGSDNLVPDNDFDYLSPFGNELRLYRGVILDDGSEEYVPLGVFVITEVSVSDANEGVEISLSGEDRALRIGRNKWTEPYQMVTGSLETSITALLKNRWVDVQTNFPATNITINQVILGLEGDNDPWKDAVEICELVGFDLFFDVNGVATMRQFPTLDGAVVVGSYIDGESNRITSLTRAISSRDTYNGIIYTIEGSEVDEPIRVEAWDEDPASATYRYGAFGEVPVFIESSLVSTEDEAVAIALLLLNRYIGAQESINWEALVDPTLDVNDVVYISSSGAKVDRLVIIDNLNVPLSPSEAMGAVARVVRVVNANEIIQVGA